jgi:hypothetical protein
MKTVQIGKGVFLINNSKINSVYAKSKLSENYKNVDYFAILEREAVIEPQNSIHCMARDSMMKVAGNDFLEIIKELAPDKSKQYEERIEWLQKK